MLLALAVEWLKVHALIGKLAVRVLLGFRVSCEVDKTFAGCVD